MESDNSQSEEEYIGGFSERVVQFIPDYIPCMFMINYLIIFY